MSETGYVYAVICAAAQVMQAFVMGVCLERLLTGRDEKISPKQRMTIWGLLCILIPGGKCLVPLPDIYLSVGNPFLMNLWFVLFLKYCYSDSGKLKFVYASMLVLQNVLMDILHGVIFGNQNISMTHFSFASRSMAQRCTSIAVISVMIHIFYTMFILKISKKKRLKTSPVWISMMLLLVLVFVAIQAVLRPEESDNSYFVFICIFAVVEFSLLMLYLSQSEKREAQEEVDKLQQAMELEKTHYEQIEARREEMAKIRHDYNNVITSVMLLIENGKTEEAGTVLRELSERISQTKEYPFCAIPIINAVLTEKEKQCKAENIRLTADLLIPDRTAVDGLDFCRIFGNLMDNAIRSCRELREQGKDSSIFLSAGVIHDYLIVKCQNTALENWGGGSGRSEEPDTDIRYLRISPENMTEIFRRHMRTEFSRRRSA